MDREKILRRIVGPLPFRSGNMKWEFVARRRVRHGKPGHGSRDGRAFTLSYDVKTRRFTATCHRRSGRKKERAKPVKLSRGMISHLQSRLLPKQIALCMAASIMAASIERPISK